MNFEKEFIDSLSSAVLANESFGFLKGNVDSFINDAIDRKKLERWYVLHSDGALSDDELMLLIQGQIGLGLISILEKKGLAKVAAQKATEEVLKIALSTALKVALA